MDVEAIEPGQNFAQRIDQTINNCQTMLVIIGPRWKTILLERMSGEHQDYVRHEIESALARKTKVIPVLVGGAVLAELSDVPSALAEISFHQAFEIRDGSFKDDCDRLARSLGLLATRKWRSGAIAAAVLVVALVLLPRGWHSWQQQHRLSSQVDQLLGTAQTQLKLGEYESAYLSAKQAVKLLPTDRQALNQQADAAMAWLEHYSVIGDDANARDLAAGQLSELMAVLDSALSRTSGNEPRSADILAHLGWAHALNQHIAEKEFGSAAPDLYRKAISIQATNVYANSMLGNWLLQRRQNLDEAMKCFSAALSTARERPLVRTLELGGMLYNDADGVPLQAVKVLNDMRRNNEPIDDRYRSRFLSVDFSPMNSDEFLNSILTAVPPDEALKTYLWLDNAPASDSQQLKRDFIAARVLELQGKRAEAIAAYTTLQHNLAAAGMEGQIAAHVADSLLRLKTPHKV
jgi:tetratricopeptide (TPR) repeat protein